MKLLKRLVRATIPHLPWHLQHTVKAAAMNWSARKPPFRGIYRSFDEVPDVIPAGEQATAAILQRANADRRDASGFQKLGRRLALCMVVAALKNGDNATFKILDFGGGGGADYASLLEATGGASALDYTIIELPTVCEEGAKLWADDPHIRYLPDIPDGETFDLCYAWSAIHYHPDVYGLISTLAARASKAVLFAGSPFHNCDFVRAQINQSVAYPQWVVSLPRVKKIMDDLGFDLALAAAGDEEHNVENYAPEHRVSGSVTLLFVRRSPHTSCSNDAPGRQRASSEH